MSEVTVQQLIEATGLQKPDLARLIGCSLATLYRWEHGVTTPKRAVIEFLRQHVDKRERKSAGSQLFRFIDLFAGIGGMRVGIERNGGACVFSSEWNSHSRETYLRNFPGGTSHPFAGDI